MQDNILDLMAQASSAAEILAGAYGYLAAAVDSYFHDPKASTWELYKDFRAVEYQVTLGLQQHFERQGVTVDILADGIKRVATELELSPEETSKVVAEGVRTIFPPTPVTES